ncbi:DUF3418 domain-containing protein, partial [Nocardia abscessus]|uniref:DUF3418 domain-containing protein n=1 Tax=Nocardia abscessus TaxID=120957 RepID=UPI0024550905
GYPALVAEGEGVAVRVLSSAAEQAAAMRLGTRALLLRALPASARTATAGLSPSACPRGGAPAPDSPPPPRAPLTPRAEPLRAGLARELSRLGSVSIAPTDFDLSALPGHLRMTFAAVGADGATLARGKSLAALKNQLAEQVSAAVARVTAGAERPPATVWTSESLGTLAPAVRRVVAGQAVPGYPAHVGGGEGVGVGVLSSAAEQAAAMRLGTRALLLRALPASARTATAGLSPSDRLALSQNPYGSVEALLDDCRAAAADELLAAAGGPVHDPAAFDALVARIRPDFASAVARYVRLVVPVLAGAHQVSAALARTSERDIADDVRHQLDNLVFRGFVSETGAARLRELPRYLHAAVARLEALPGSAVRDRQGMAELDRVLGAYDRFVESLPATRRHAPAVTEIWWMIEELRVSLFAQKLGTPFPVSAKRIEKAIAAVRR